MASESVSTQIEEQHNNPSSIQQQRIMIENKFSEKLVRVLNETGSTEIVILCHGFRSSKDKNPMANLIVVLGKEGITAFRFDYAGNGESEGSFQYGNYHRDDDDLHVVIQQAELTSVVLAFIKEGLHPRKD